MKMRTLCGTILAAVALSVFAREPNYDEAKVAPYTLEDPLAFADGRKLRDASEGPTLAGLAIRRQYRMWFKADKSGHYADWLLVLPNRLHGQFPVVDPGRILPQETRGGQPPQMGHGVDDAKAPVAAEQNRKRR